MRKTFIILFTLFVLPFWIYADDVDPSAFSKWLCGVLTSPRPEKELINFPSKDKGKVEFKKEKETDDGETYVSFEWTLDAGSMGYEIYYTYQENRGEKFGFKLSIESKIDIDESSLIFRSENQAHVWLTRLGKVYKKKVGKRYPHNELIAVDHYDEFNRDYRWKVVVDVRSKRIEIEWLESENNLGRRFCN